MSKEKPVSCKEGQPSASQAVNGGEAFWPAQVQTCYVLPRVTGDSDELCPLRSFTRHHHHHHLLDLATLLNPRTTTRRTDETACESHNAGLQALCRICPLHCDWGLFRFRFCSLLRLGTPVRGYRVLHARRLGQVGCDQAGHHVQCRDTAFPLGDRPKAESPIQRTDQSLRNIRRQGRSLQAVINADNARLR